MVVMVSSSHGCDGQLSRTSSGWLYKSIF